MVWLKYILLTLFCCLQISTVSSNPFTNDNTTITTHPGFVSSIEKRLVNFVHKTVSTMRYTAYKLGGSHFDTSRGIYVLDCSTYIDNILENVHPEAYSTLMNSSGSEKPTTREYYNFFTQLTDDSDYCNKELF